MHRFKGYECQGCALTAPRSHLIPQLGMQPCMVACRAALGMYDVELAYMVISHAQRDPGEYLLELQGFAGKPSTALTRHAIDVHLRRWDRALQHLLAAGEGHFGDALALAQSKVGCTVLCV